MNKVKARNFEATVRTLKAKVQDKACTTEAKVKDTIFVLEDPRGQGLCSRTASLIYTKGTTFSCQY